MTAISIGQTKLYKKIMNLETTETSVQTRTFNFPVKDVYIGETLFGAGENVIFLFPKFIPRTFIFTEAGDPWKNSAMKLFKTGLHKDSKLIPNYGINKERALRHIFAILNSQFIDKRTKILNTAFLLSLWFKECIIL